MRKDFIFSYSIMALSLLIGYSRNSQDLKITKKKRTNLNKTESSAGWIDQNALSFPPHVNWFIPKYNTYKAKMELF
ncbi:hypothetical protein [Bacteroidetes bacterium endosymbiont of Geopemphigus sp.]|uniref:hypothetical protein n=1 Tax=Bacteroidetes bacterium endosymbiont of Geopemphigus sp. TaxID=2047937 RepID=UPI0011AEFBF2|nr:hypothetical protein [Bacteroidetes bacterium endosymbiont of Geopemphigus sp.]